MLHLIDVCAASVPEDSYTLYRFREPSLLRQCDIVVLDVKDAMIRISRGQREVLMFSARQVN